MPKLSVGSQVSFKVQSISGKEVFAPSKDSPFTHIQFRRFAGCPICNLHLRSFGRRYEEIKAAGIQELVFFHSSANQLQDHELPFELIADPEKKWYKEFKVESSWKSVMSFSAATGYMSGVAGGLGLGMALKDDHLGLPADILLDKTGKVIAVKYGANANDQWNVDELLAFVKGQEL